MHELSIALSLIEVATEALNQQGAVRVQTLHLKLGCLSGVVKEALSSAFEVARVGTPFESATLWIEEVAVEIFCRSCNASQRPESPTNLRCPTCGTATSQLLRGRELELVALEIE